jgi:hypothetical protein
MHIRSQLGAVIGACVLVLAVACEPGIACLRDTLDDRAVEWSKLIVVAKLSALHNPVSLSPPSAKPPTNSVGSFQLYEFEITSIVDGKMPPGKTISIIRFLTAPDAPRNSICGQQLTAAQIGKSFLLLLRPESDLRWSNTKAADPRDAQLHKLNAFMVVHLESTDDLGAEGLADAKYTISSTRQAEAQFNPDDAKVQVQTLINAADDTEQDQAEHAILEMGPKALPALEKALPAADDIAKVHLQKIIDAVSPPAITTAMEPH